MKKPQRRVWSEENIRKEAAKWRGKTDLQNNCQTAYQAAVRMGILDTLYSGGYRKWDEVSIREIASGFVSKKLFNLAYPGAYGAAARKYPGLLDELFSNLKLPMENNAIYIWRAVGEFYNGNPVYKIGVTSARLGDWRIKLCANKWGVAFELMCLEVLPAGVKATDVEKKLLILGENPGYGGIDGHTEFRAMSDSALYAAVSIIASHL